MARMRPTPARTDSAGSRTARPRVPFVPGILAAGVLGTLAASLLLWGREEAASQAALEDHQIMVVDSVEEALEQTTIRLISLAGLYQASEVVSRIEFRRFVRNLGQSPGLDAIGYMPLVVGRNRAAYQAEMQAIVPGFSIFELDEEGRRIPAGERRVHVPLEIYEPEDAFASIAGFDSMSSPDRVQALERSRLTRDVAITRFLTLISESQADGFLVYWPVTDAGSDALTGYAVAAMDLSNLMEAAVAPFGKEILAWEITDRTGEPITERGPTLDVGGRTWEITITPAPGSEMVADPTYPLILLSLGLAATGVGVSALSIRRRQRQAQAEYERLRELTRAKDQFLASVGHELRTPLTSVLGFAQVLRSDGAALSEEDRGDMIATVADEATDLAAIVDDLLVAARSELDLLVVQKLAVSARAQVAQVLETYNATDRQRVEVVADPETPYRAIADPGRVRQILRNLITNAGRYGGGQVAIRLRQDDDTVRIEVRDDGPGVPGEESELIFDPYYRAHPQGSQPAALGIGLAVARRLARLMGGDVTYRRQGGWTVFELVLPRASSVEEEPSRDQGAVPAI